MNQYLIFRTDRIGDFLLSATLIKSIKRNEINSEITVNASEKNYEYIRNFKLVDNVILYPAKGVKKKINFIINLIKRRFYCILVLDGKKRSLYSSIILRSKIKISLVTK